MKDMNDWRARVHKWKIEFHAASFAWFQCSFEPHSCAVVAYHQERGGMPSRDVVGVKCK